MAPLAVGPAGLSSAVWGPQNHLDAESVSWLQNTLAAFPGTVVAVTHDRYFLDSVAGWILELDQGKGARPLPAPSLHAVQLALALPVKAVIYPPAGSGMAVTAVPSFGRRSPARAA